MEKLGYHWPPEVAYAIGDHRGLTSVTWAEVRQRRRWEQARRLENLRRTPEPRVVPCYVWTFFNDTDLFCGWWCYIVTRHERYPARWDKYFDRPLAESVMRAIPMGLAPIEADFERWMEELADRYPRRHPRDQRKAGSVVGWLENRQRFLLSGQRG